MQSTGVEGTYVLRDVECPRSRSIHRGAPRRPIHRMQRDHPVQGRDGRGLRPARGRRRDPRRGEHRHGAWRPPRRNDHRHRRIRARAERRDMWPRQGATALVLGAGGAAASVALALTRVPLLRLRIAARKPDAARQLARRLRRLQRCRDDSPGTRRRSRGRARTPRSSSTRRRPGLDALPFDPRAVPTGCSVVDIRYRPRPVDVVTAAIESGHRAEDGLEMLLQQGLLSFATGAGWPHR